MKSISILIKLIVIFTTIATICFLIWHNDLELYMGKNAYKTSYQFLLIVVLGGYISLLYKELSINKENKTKERIRQQEKHQVRDNLRREFYDALVLSYNNVKKIRRLLRAQSLTGAFDQDSEIKVKFIPYDEQMQLLIDAQLQFEFLIHQVKGNPHLFEPSEEILEKCLLKIEKYLGGLVREYEKHLSNFTGESSLLALSQLPKLKEFISHFNNSGAYKTSFTFSYYQSINVMQKLLFT